MAAHDHQDQKNGQLELQSVNSAAACSGQDTIAAIATPLGFGALGIVRLSGPEAIAITAGFFRSTPPFSNALARQALIGRIVSSQDPFTDKMETIDWAVAIKYPAPASYTGEDVVEITTHGSPLILRQVLRNAFVAGAREALPGEFTQRAFINGKLDLAQAQAVGAMIKAVSIRAAKAAARGIEGYLSSIVKEVNSELVSAAAALEVLLDHPDEPEISEAFDPDFVLKRLHRQQETLEGLASGYEQTHKIREGFNIAIAGKPNAGKSTLFNRLIMKDRAIVSDIPGTTRDTVEEMIDIGGYLVKIVDTAGLRRQAGIIESLGLERTQAAMAAADIVLWVVDGADAEVVDTDIKAWGTDKEVVSIFNKKDHPRFKQGAAWQRENTVVVSALTGEGMGGLKECIIRYINKRE